MPATGHLLRASFRRLSPAIDELQERWLNRWEAECPEIGPLLAAARISDASVELAQFLAVVARSADDVALRDRYLDGLAERAEKLGLAPEHFAAARETLLETLAEAAGDWDTELESAWAEVLESVAQRLSRSGNASRGPVPLKMKSPLACATPTNRAEDETPIYEASQSMLTESINGMPLVDDVVNVASDTATPAYLMGMVEDAPLTKFFVRSDGIVGYLNRKGRELFSQLAPKLGFGPDELIGANISRLYERLPELREKVHGLTGQVKLRVALADDWLEIYLVPVNDGRGRRIGHFQGWSLVSDVVRSEQRIKENLENARALNQVMQALGGAKTVDQAARLALDGVREAFGWAYGSFWQNDPNENLLRFSSESGNVTPEFRQVTETATFAEGVGLSGRAWKQRNLVFVADLAEVPDCVRAPAARRAGVKSGVCLPLLVEGNVLGTMDFFALQTLTLSNERLETLKNVGQMVSQTIERLRESERQAEIASNATAVNSVLEALGRTTNPREAVLAVLNTVREAFGWAYGSYWVLDRKEKVLKFAVESGSVTAEFRQVTEQASFAEGVGLSGRTWRQKDLVFVPDLSQVHDCVRAPAARRAGVKSGVCFPIIVSGEVVGTMDFFSLSKVTLSSEREEALRSVGRLVSSTIQTLDTTARYRSMLDGLPTNVLLADDQFRITYINPASMKQLKAIEKLLPIKADQVIGKSIDIFHKNPAHQRGIVGDPSNLPHRTRFQLGPETLDLLVTAVKDSAGNYLGPMVTWSVITDQVRLADQFEQDVKGVVGAVSQSAMEVQDGSRNMAATTEETARQAQVVAAASEQATRNVQTVSAATEELTASISEIARHVQDASRMTAEAVREADRTNGTVKELGEASNQIGQVIKVISSIAQQTNLLALNATIEAARAGEAGKGFAVVANEVKELARQTAKATEEISQKIAAIQSSTGVAVQAIETIGGRISKINEIATTIASAVEEQTAATNEISRNVAEAARGTAEVSGNIAAVSQAADEGGRGAASMLTAADRLTAESDRLGKTADEFLKRMRAI